ncbi:hypothetical protein PMAYCL1PPCAC_19283, partial [Pristionchus mayeri]
FYVPMRRSDEGILLRKKQEQWAREKEERAADNWFPFGSPGGGNPNKKHVARDYEAAAKSPTPYVRPAAENVPPPQDPSTSGRVDTVATSRPMEAASSAESSVGRGGGTTSDESSRSRTAAPPAAAA